MDQKGGPVSRPDSCFGPGMKTSLLVELNFDETINFDRKHYKYRKVDV